VLWGDTRNFGPTRPLLSSLCSTPLAERQLTDG
jgi:hypothetical protein